MRGIDLFVRSDAAQLAELAARVDHGELTVDVAERVALTDLPTVHARAAAGTLAGKVIVRPTSDSPLPPRRQCANHRPEIPTSCVRPTRRYCARLTVETSAQISLWGWVAGLDRWWSRGSSCRTCQVWSIAEMIAPCRSSTTCVLTTSVGRACSPLNALRVAHPDVYDRECAKWAGRESVLQWQVPHLGVAWGDTVNLAALDPVHLLQARKRLGVPFSRLLGGWCLSPRGGPRSC